MQVERAADLAGDRFAVARAALSELPLSVVVVGAGHGGERSCATGTAMYVSFAPPQLAVALHPGSRTCRLVEASHGFSVSALRADQLDLAMDAGRGGSGDDKFAELGAATVETAELPGVPGLDDAAFVSWCRVVQAHSTGDHRLFIGEVVAFGGPTSDRPLLRHRRRYAALGEFLSETAPEGYPT
jgi:flavin reductase (DIM6/NTAB) family NADH-FMN oxidoreductase RutF